MDTEFMTDRTEGQTIAVQSTDVQSTVSAPDDPLLTVMGLIFESSAGAQALLEGTLDPHGDLTGQLLEPLLRLSRTDGGRLRMTDLAAQCRYSASAVTRVSDRLETLGLAERQSCPSDRRVIYLAITDAGRAAVAAAMPAHVRMIDEAILGTLDADERVELERLMRKVRDAVHPCATAVTPLGAEPSRG
jgi:DNA-binding MarR family transcriptional regulator